MKNLLSNKVIIIGPDHHNTLAAIRCFGRQKCNISILVHGSYKDLNDVKLSYSKYSKGKTELVREDIDDIISWLKIHQTEEKQIVFPCSDFAEYAIDSNFELLKDGYILPGFANAPGKCAFLMDKWNQYNYLQTYGIPMAKTWKLIKTKENAFEIPENITYPCIIKPSISAFGNKSDICICDDDIALKKAFENFVLIGYESLLIQEFVTKNFEICAYGTLGINPDYSAGTIIKKEREFPPRGGGSLTYARVICESKINDLVKSILKILSDDGYTGQYDIEFFVCDNEIYLNEINFRHSGNGYALIKNKVFAPYIWCLSSLKIPMSENMKTKVKPGKTHMDEIPDLVHRKNYNLSFWKWIKDFIFASARSKFDICDIPGTSAYYVPLFKRGINKVFRRKNEKGN